MDIHLLREQLHEYINAADKQHLSAIYTLVEDKIHPVGNETYDTQTMDMIYERRENHRKGVSKSYSVEEAMKLVKQSKNNGL